LLGFSQLFLAPEAVKQRLFLFTEPPLDELSFGLGKMRSQHPAISFNVFAARKYGHIPYIMHRL
jgi:hypothetical protein